MSRVKDLLREWVGPPNPAAAGLGVAADPDAWIRHRPWRGLPAEGAFVTAGHKPPDDAAIGRLLAAYRRSHAAAHYGADSMWRGFFEGRQAGLHRIFLEGSISEARQALSDPGQNDLFYGFDNLMRDSLKVVQAGPQASPKEYSDWIGGFGLAGRSETPAEILKAHARHLLDDLLRCAETWGALRCENPEWGVVGAPSPDAKQWKSNTLTADEVLAKLESALGVRIVFPNPYARDFGLATSRGVATFRAIHSLDLALRARQLTRHLASPRVLEIGGGLGRSAFYALQFGLPGYEILDLPFTAISQGYFLMATLGADKVTLAGEAARENAGGVRLSAPAEFLESDARYDLVVNLDSLTEIDPAIARQYWAKIEACADRFLSINHEANSFTVRDLYAGSPRVKRFSRHPCWLRRGYVEEMVEFN